MSSSSAKSGISDISKHLVECKAGEWYSDTVSDIMVQTNKVRPQTSCQRHLTCVMAWIEKKILKNSKIKHLGGKPGDFGEIKVTTHSIFDKKKDRNFGFGSAGDLLI